MSRDPRECTSGHIFCTSCIVAWATGEADGSAKCPVCRVPGRYYRPSAQAHYLVSRKMVGCPEQGCKWTGILREYKFHKKERHSGPDSAVEGLVPIQLFLKSKIYGRKRQDEYEGDDTGDEGMGDGVVDNGNDARDLRNYCAYGDSVGDSHINQSTSDPLTDLLRINNHHQNHRPIVVPLNTATRQHRRRGSVRGNAAKESLEEVESIRHQLSKVSGDLSLLLEKMSRDHEKYMGFINSRPCRTLEPLPDSFYEDQQFLRQHAERGSCRVRDRASRGHETREHTTRPGEQNKGKMARVMKNKSIASTMPSKGLSVKKIHGKERKN